MSTKPYALFSLAAFVVTLGATTGCAGNPEQLAKTKARMDCKRLKECNKAAFDDDYGGDLGRCKGAIEDDYLDIADDADDRGCDYDKENGQQCVKTSRKFKNDCSEDADREIAEDCDVYGRLYDCPGLLDLDEPEESPDDFTTPEDEVDEDAEPATYPEGDLEYVAPPVR